MEPSGRRALLLVFLVLLATGAAALVATNRYGIGLLPDSVIYMDGARSIEADLEFSRFGEPIIHAPAYPAVLAVGERLGLDAEDGARALAAGAFVATTLLGYVLLRRHVRSPYVVLAGTVVIGCSAVLLGVFKYALSEHLFIILVLLVILAAEDLIARPRSLRLIAGMTVLAWVAFYLRYAGIFLVPLMALFILIACWPLGRVPALVRSGGFVVVSVVGIVPWMIRNVDATGGVLGPRRPPSATPLTNAARTATALTGWITFDGPGKVRLAVFLVMLAAAAVVLVALVRAHPNRASLTNLARRAQEMWPLALLVVVYVVYLAATASIAAFTDINTRYLIPVYVPLVVAGAWSFELVRDRLSVSRQKVLTLLVLVWVACNVGWFGARAVNSASDGAGGFATTRWHQSVLPRDIENVSPSVPMYTNEIYGVEVFTGRNAAISPARNFQASTEATGALPAFVRRVACARRVELIWFLPNSRKFLYTPQQLSRHVRLIPRVRRADGIIYDVTPLPSSTVRCAR